VINGDKFIDGVDAFDDYLLVANGSVKISWSDFFLVDHEAAFIFSNGCDSNPIPA
jgi:hypothetical protein